MSKTKITEAPYNENGDLLRYPNGRNAVWKENTPFPATMTFERKVYSYQAAGYVYFRDERGCQYPMYRSALPDLIARAVINKGTVTAMWMVEKKGRNYGLRLAKEAEID